MDVWVDKNQLADARNCFSKPDRDAPQQSRFLAARKISRLAGNFAANLEQRPVRNAISKKCAAFRNMCGAMWRWNLLMIKMNAILVFSLVSLVILQFGVDVNSRYQLD
jgi:hypothetical protein